jgi:E3 ubiquitin-protein ligase DOA10
MFAELGLFPLMLGTLLDTVTVDLFGTTLDNRRAFWKRSPIMFLILYPNSSLSKQYQMNLTRQRHWLVGMGYMVHFASFVQWVREIVRPGVLWFMRDPADPDFNPLKEMVEVGNLFLHFGTLLIVQIAAASFPTRKKIGGVRNCILHHHLALGVAPYPNFP